MHRNPVNIGERLGEELNRHDQKREKVVFEGMDEQKTEGSVLENEVYGRVMKGLSRKRDINV